MSGMTEEELEKGVEDFLVVHGKFVHRLAGIPPNAKFQALDKYITNQIVESDPSKEKEIKKAFGDAAKILRDALARNITTPEEAQAFLRDLGPWAVDLINTITRRYVDVIEKNPEGVAEILGISLEEVRELAEAGRRAIEEGEGASLGILRKILELEAERAKGSG
uniref:Win31 n=1 Tax=synthetic construct TaxID=32630 RepID=UPI0039FDE1BD